MGIERKEVKTYLVEYACNTCGKPMKGTGITYMCNPPKYPHNCTNGHYETLDAAYPHMAYEPCEEVEVKPIDMVVELPARDPNAVKHILFDGMGEDKGVYFDEDSKPCEVESCKGTCLTVLWDDGETTHPCTEGTFINEDGNRQCGILNDIPESNLMYTSIPPVVEGGIIISENFRARAEKIGERFVARSMVGPINIYSALDERCYKEFPSLPSNS
jgi:hypothetical protein